MYTNKHAWTNKDGTYKEVYYYICGRNKQERGHHCDYKASLRKTDIEPLVIEAVKELVSDKYFAKEIEKRIGVQIDTTAIDKELANYESKLKEVDLNKARLEREIDNLPIDARFRERKIHDMTLRLDALYDTIVELEERIEDAKLRKSSIEMETITLDNIYKLMLNFGKLYDIISDEEKKSLITYLIKEIQIYPNGESEQPLKSIEFNFPIYRDGQEVRRLLWEKGNTVETVVVPQYYSANNGADNSKTAIKVTKISPTAFKGNQNIKTVVLPIYVDEIPDGAFEGCTNLENVIAFGVTKIGANAFKGCTNLTAFSIDNMVTSLGNNAFENVSELRVQAANESVFDAALNSGANRLIINTSLMNGTLDNKVINIASDKNYFALLSNGAKYDNLQIVSNSNETYISNMIFAENIDTPLKLKSEKVTLNRVVVENAPGFALILENDNTALSLYGTVDLGSTSENAILSKNLTLSEENPEVASEINSYGDVLVCGDVSNSSMLNVTDNNDNKYEKISEEEFQKFLTSSKITFDANGGEPDLTSKTVYYGQAYGEMPIPTKANYTFDGWYTAASAGTKITADTVVTALVNQTLYAHWTPNKFTVTYDVNGENATVSTTSKTLSFGDALGELPVPTREFYRFDGWFTEKDGGSIINESTTPDVAEDITVYAHWSENSLSDWVKSSEMPSDAVAVNTKYSYTLRSYTTSSSSSMNGWTKYDTQRTSWGATQGPVYSNPSGNSRNVWSEQYVKSTTTHYKYYHRWNGKSGSSGLWGTDSTAKSWKRHTYETTSQMSHKYTGSSGIKFYGTHKCPTCGAQNMWVPDGSYKTNNYATRWYYQDPVYTYYYYKDENKEATIDPTGQSNVSNIQEWVQYRVK